MTCLLHPVAGARCSFRSGHSMSVQDKILELLSNSKGNILDDEDLSLSSCRELPSPRLGSLSRTFHGIICLSHEQLLWAAWRSADRDMIRQLASLRVGACWPRRSSSKPIKFNSAGLQDTLQHNAKLSPVRKVQFQGTRFLEPITPCSIYAKGQRNRFKLPIQ